MRVVVPALCALLLSWSPAWALSDGIGDFQARAREFQAMMLDHCRRNSARLFPTLPRAATQADPAALRQACGRALGDKPIPGADGWRFAFDGQNPPGALIDTLGAWKPLPGGPTEMVVLVGLQTTVSRPHRGRERVTEEPTAVVFENQGGTWTAVWQFVDPAGRWNLPPVNAAAGTLDPARNQRIHAAWTREVTAGFGRMLRDLGRNRGMGFP